ncbi:MMPL family transporter [Actinomycetota bacterium]
MTRLTDLSIRRRWLTLAVWLVLTAGLIGLAQAKPGPTSDDYTMPDAPSSAATELLERHGLSDDEGHGGQVVLESAGGLAAHDDKLHRFVDDITREHPDWELRSDDKATGLSGVSADGRIGYLDVTIPESEDPAAAGEALRDLAPKSEGLSTAYLGDIAPAAGGGPGEGIGILAAVVILLIAFGSVLGMAVPIVVAIFGAITGVMALSLSAHLVEMSSAATPLAAMLGVGVGIDYSLLVVTRYREALAEGMTPREAVSHSMDTAGRSVLFAGVTVVIAVLGLLIMDMPLVSGIAIGAALAIALTMLAALTLLPAVLSLVGRHIDRFAVPGRHGVTDGEHGFFERWSRAVQRRPWAAAIGSLGMLLVLAIPALDLRLGFDDASSLPQSTTQRQAYDRMTEGFGPGVHGPLFVAVDGEDAGAGELDEALPGLRSSLEQTQGVASVEGPFPSEDGEAAVAIVTPTTAPDAQETADLVHRLRDQTLPSSLDGGVSADVTGTTAAVIDYAEHTMDKLPLFVGVVLALAFVLLMAVFRSILVPLKAVVMNLLSIAASFGVVVAIVQWGWLGGLFGFEKPIAVTAWVPMMLVAVVFGLSMDYEVFLLGRIREFYDRGMDNGTAVARGLAHTGRVITAAAAIMVCVFGGFVLGSAVDLSVFGLGLAVAVLIDATIVRMVLVPALMELMGDANWWLPRIVSRVVGQGVRV